MADCPRCVLYHVWRRDDCQDVLAVGVYVPAPTFLHALERHCHPGRYDSQHHDLYDAIFRSRAHIIEITNKIVDSLEKIKSVADRDFTVLKGGGEHRVSDDLGDDSPRRRETR